MTFVTGEASLIINAKNVMEEEKLPAMLAADQVDLRKIKQL